MAQFTGSTVQSMTTDDIKYKRTDGCFLSYKRAAIFLPIFIFGIIAAGLIGWYSHSMPKKRIQDALSLLDDDGGKERDSSSSTSSFVHPLKYWLYFKPTIMEDRSVSFKGRVVIEFRIEAPGRLNELSLSATNLTVKRYELSFPRDSGNSSEETQREKRTVEVTVSESDAINSTIDDTTTVIYENTESSDDRSENETRQNSNDTLLDTEENSFFVNNIGKGKESIEIKEYKVDRVKELHVIHTRKVLKNGTYFLTIDYEAFNLTDVVYFADLANHDEKRWTMGTSLKPSGTRRVFPLFEGIHRRASFSLSVERPKEMRVLSNMPLRSTKDASSNWVIDTFDDTPAILPDDLAFVIGDLRLQGKSTIEGDNVAVSFWIDAATSLQFTGEMYLLNQVRPIVRGLSNFFSSPFNLPKLDLVALPSTVIEESASTGLVSMRRSLFLSVDRSAVVTKTEASKSLIRLLAEQWLGGRVYIKSWTDTWILEGSLVYLQDRLIDEIDSSLQLAHSFVADVQIMAMENDGYSVSRSFQTKTDPNDDSMERNSRGACLIRMLHDVAGNDSVFRNAYENFLIRCENSTVDVGDFLTDLNIPTTDLPEKLSLKEMMDRWITQSGYPLVTVTRDYERGSTIVKQRALFYDKPTAERDTLWYVPLTYVQNNSDWSRPTKIWLKPDGKAIVHKTGLINDEGNKTSWILFNVNKTGYYRVNYDETNWRLLGTALDENHESFPSETRASLVDDVFALAAVGTSRYETAFGFIKYMQMKERHYAPWSAFAHHVFKLNNLLYETSAFLDFQEFLQQFIAPLYDEVSEHLNEGSPLTLLAIKLGCLSEYSKCLDWAKLSFVRLKKDPAYKSTIPKYLRGTLYCAIAKYGGREEWNYLSQKAKNTLKLEEKYNLLSSYGCFQTLAILNSILDEVLRGNVYNEAEISVILKSFSTNLIASRAASKFVQGNWNEILDRFSGSYLAMKSFVLAMSNSHTTELDLNDLHTFWEDNYESIKTVKRVAALVEARANFATSFVQNYSHVIRDWLKKFNRDHGV